MTTTTTAAMIVRFPEFPAVVLDVVDTPGEDVDDVGGALVEELVEGVFELLEVERLVEGVDEVVELELNTLVLVLPPTGWRAASAVSFSQLPA